MILACRFGRIRLQRSANLASISSDFGGGRRVERLDFCVFGAMHGLYAGLNNLVLGLRKKEKKVLEA
jgi:hypothetical protein